MTLDSFAHVPEETKELDHSDLAKNIRACNVDRSTLECSWQREVVANGPKVMRVTFSKMDL